MAWMNDDGLYVTFGVEKSQPAIGGALKTFGGTKVLEVDMTYEDFAVAQAVVGVARGKSEHGPMIPKGAVVEKLELVVTTAFTVSGGTADTVQFVIGTMGADDRLNVDADDFTTTSFTGAQLSLEQVGNVVTVEPEATGAGDIYGVATAENLLLSAYNPRQGTDILNAGAMTARIYYR